MPHQHSAATSAEHDDDHDDANDTATGPAGDDTSAGASGDDTMTGPTGDDTVGGTAGADDDGDHHDQGAPLAGETLTGTSGADHLEGGPGPDSLSGGDGDDRLRGGDGDDTLDGGAGDDTLVTGDGADVLTGGQGHDIFVIKDHLGATEDALPHITDFTHGEDRLVFDGDLSLTDGKFASGTADTFDAAVDLARTDLASGHLGVAAIQVGADVIVFSGHGHDHHIDSAVVLVGKTLADLGVTPSH